MRSLALLVPALVLAAFVLTACRNGSPANRPADGDPGSGWRVVHLDEETEFYEPVDTPCAPPAARPCATPTVRRTPPAAAYPQPVPVATPRPPPAPSMVRPPARPAVPPPPPPPAWPVGR